MRKKRKRARSINSCACLFSDIESPFILNKALTLPQMLLQQIHIREEARKGHKTEMNAFAAKNADDYAKVCGAGVLCSEHRVFLCAMHALIVDLVAKSRAVAC